MSGCPTSSRGRGRTSRSGALDWLRTVLNYKLPPATVQELGSAHGGFVALLRRAGYEATGLELSPSIVEYATKVFAAPMRCGPLESQAIAAGSLDVIAMMDVLEHLPSPVATMGHAASLLKPDGLFVVQTPAFPEGATYEEMLSRDDYFLNHMRNKQAEHLFLFSRRAATELMRRLGFPFVSFEPAIFAAYDMYFVASRAPLEKAHPNRSARP